MLKKSTKGLSTILTMSTGGYLDVSFEKLGGDVFAWVECLYLFLLIFDPNAEMETKFVKYIKRDFDLSSEN